MSCDIVATATRPASRTPRTAGKTLRSAPSVVYSREGVLRFLESVMPDFNWRSLEARIPRVVLRRDWPRLSKELGLPYKRVTLANLDCQGRGPLQTTQAAFEEEARQQ